VTTPEQVLAARRAYYGAISLVDDHVGAILSTLREHGLADDTVVVVTSDHGDMLGERGLWYKMAPFEGSIRVPLIVHAPERFAARRVDGVVSLLDLLPTLVELAGGSVDGDGGLDGTSLLPALEGESTPDRDVPLEYLAEGVRAPQATLVRGPLKLVRELGEPDLLFDLAADPCERVDVSGDRDYADVLRSLAGAADARWDLARLDVEVRASQERRRVVASALATGTLTAWDHPGTPGGPYIRTGDDFWSTLESAREP
jgi:choline-sulfatase